MLRKTVREFSKDQCTDLAAALTYYAVLALFPGLLALMSLVGLLGQGQESARTILDILRDVGVGSVADTLEPTLIDLSRSSRRRARAGRRARWPRCGRPAATSTPSGGR